MCEKQIAIQMHTICKKMPHIINDMEKGNC